MNLEDLEKLAKSATPGPRKYFDHRNDEDLTWGTFSIQNKEHFKDPFFFISDAEDVDDTKQGSLILTNADAEYIAAVSPDVVLKMIQQLRAADELLQYVECYNGLGVTNCLTKNVPCGGCKAVKKYRKLRDLREEG